MKSRREKNEQKRKDKRSAVVRGKPAVCQPEEDEGADGKKKSDPTGEIRE